MVEKKNPSVEKVLGTQNIYWEGFYWEGFSPEVVNAIPLSSSVEILNQSDTDSPIKIQLNQICSDLNSKNYLAENFYFTLIPLKNRLVIRLWHKNVFLGARASGTGDPGKDNMDYHFNDDKKIILCCKWEDSHI